MLIKNVLQLTSSGKRTEKKLNELKCQVHIKRGASESKMTPQ